ncbi:unnamed protein product, partial [marine sediment metagenome]
GQYLKFSLYFRLEAGLKRDIDSPFPLFLSRDWVD